MSAAALGALGVAVVVLLAAGWLPAPVQQPDGTRNASWVLGYASVPCLLVVLVCVARPGQGWSSRAWVLVPALGLGLLLAACLMVAVPGARDREAPRSR